MTVLFIPRPIRYPPYFPRADSTGIPASRRFPTYRRTARSVIPSRPASCSPLMPGEFCTISRTISARAVGVVSGLMSKEERPKQMAKVREEYAQMAASYARGQAEKARASLGQARANAFKIDWSGYQPPKPTFLGTRIFEDYDLAELARYIDWTPFFQAWELKGAFPRILEDDKYGEAARQLYDDARAMLKQIIDEKLKIAEASGVSGAEYYEKEIMGKGVHQFRSKRDAARKP